MCARENYLKQAQKEPISELQTHNRTEKTLGSDEFIKQAEKLLKREGLMKRKHIPKVNEIRLVKYYNPKITLPFLLYYFPFLYLKIF
jgi:hypothetical protein